MLEFAKFSPKSSFSPSPNGIPAFPHPSSESPRRLEHYSLFTYSGHVAAGTTQYFPFYNTHTATTSISVYKVVVSGDVVFKVGRNAVWMYVNNAYGTIWVYPTVVSNGGIVGSYTVDVHNFSYAGGNGDLILYLAEIDTNPA